MSRTLVMTFLLLGLLALPASAQDPSGEYTIDNTHTSALFRVKHMNVAYFYGRFRKISGSVSWNHADPSKSSISVEVEASSIYTGNKNRDKHLKSASFFDTNQFPKITFKSTSIKLKKDAKTTYVVTGDFTLHGVKKSITFDFELTGHGPNPRGGGDLIGGEAVFTIKRSEYGMKSMLKGLSDDVRLTISIEAAKKKKE